MSITGSLIKISLNIKQCAFRQLLWALQPSKVKWGAQNRAVTPPGPACSVFPRADFTGLFCSA